MAACDTVILLDYPTELCLEGVRSRRGTVRSDMPWVEVEEDAEFVDFIKSFAERQMPAVIALIEKYNDSRQISVFKSRGDADEFLRNLSCRH